MGEARTIYATIGATMAVQAMAARGPRRVIAKWWRDDVNSLPVRLLGVAVMVVYGGVIMVASMVGWPVITVAAVVMQRREQETERLQHQAIVDEIKRVWRDGAPVASPPWAEYSPAQARRVDV